MMAKHSRLGSVEDQVRSVIYGNCIGDALGLLTEFMTKEGAKVTYGKSRKSLAYSDKVPDMHRMRWGIGDWTDDSDQMILILQTVINNGGKVNIQEFAQRLKKWRLQGFRELGDFAGMGVGRTTAEVMDKSYFLENPHQAAEAVWKARDCSVAPNGGIMRTSALGCLHYNDLEEVTQNTLSICKVTHFDPRCQASCVVATTAIALMLQRDAYFNADKEEYDVESILKKSVDNAVQHVFKDLDDKAAKEKELRKFVFSDSKHLKDLHLDEANSIGYTYKCLGSGCWSLRQKNFEAAMQELAMEAGDADTNGAIAGALLGCKLGLQALDVKRGESGWLSGLLHKAWLDDIIKRFLGCLNTPRHRVMSQEEMDVVFKETRV